MYADICPFCGNRGGCMACGRTEVEHTMEAPVNKPDLLAPVYREGGDIDMCTGCLPREGCDPECDPSRSVTGVEESELDCKPGKVTWRQYDELPQTIPPKTEGVGETKRRYGHPRFYEIIEELADLHSDKNHDYAVGGDPLGNFKRVAAILSLYSGLDLSDPSVVALVYAMKQLDAILWMKSNKHTARVEGTVGRLQDVAVYSMITMILEEVSNADKLCHARGC